MLLNALHTSPPGRHVHSGTTVYSHALIHTVESSGALWKMSIPFNHCLLITMSTFCMAQRRTVPSIQPVGRNTTRQIFALLRAMMNINHYQRHAPSNHVSRIASTDPVLSRSAWTYQQSRRCRNLAGISGKQTGLSLRKASLKVSIAYHRGVKTTNLLSPRTRNIFQEEYENHTSHAVQMKARPYTKIQREWGSRFR